MSGESFRHELPSRDAGVPVASPSKAAGEGTRRGAWRVLSAVMLAAYFATGIYTVPANEVAVVRRFGRAVFPAKSSGLHIDFPWPMSRVDRVNLNASRTLSLGDASAEAGPFLTDVSSESKTFLTGDKNLLQLRIVVQYRVSEEFLSEWLYGSVSPERRLGQLVEATAADLVSRSGVDFVHTQGLSELNNRLLLAVRASTAQQRLGCDIEQVTVDRAEPPTRVKAEFLDVSNARADMVRSVNEARGYAEQKLAESQADARQLIDNAERDRRAKVSAAHGSADRFIKLVEQLQRDAGSSGRSYDASRNLTMQRLYVETLREVLGRAKSKVVLDGSQPADVFMSRDREQEPANRVDVPSR
jgi:modulator of FtsH protease HflK